VSSSGYYAWRKRGPSQRSLTDAELLVEIGDIYLENKKRYGSPRIFEELRARGYRVSRKRVEHLMRADGLRAKHPRKFKVTTDSNHQDPVAKNTLNREFEVDVPNARWAADITFVWTNQGWLYLAVVMDLFSRRIVGWQMSTCITRQLVIDALQMALQARRPESGLLHHSDRGCQYASFNYRKMLEDAGCVCSMSRKGNCWDNAPVESFFATLKRELVHDRRYQTRRQAQSEIFEFIEVWYNRKRRHSSLGYLCPAEYEEKMFTQSKVIAA
jgi:transposase InsO family protein